METNLPILSIIVPTYNRGTLLIPTLNSLISQNESNYEIIVVDDGSTDNTEALVNGLISRTNQVNIYYHKISNRERGAARNFGVSKAQGDYVNFFDSDDIAYNNHVAIFNELAASAGYPDAFAVSYEIMNTDRVILNSKILNKPVSEFIVRGNDLSCNGVFIKREVAFQNPFSEDRALSGSEDYELWLRLAANYEFPCFPNVSHAVIQHEARSTMNFDPEPLIRRKLLMLELAFDQESVMKRFGDSKKSIRSAAFSYIALHIAMTGKSKKKSFHWFLKSFLTSPSSIFTRRSAAILKHLLR